MRILQIRFANLNSLAGEWEIDLTHPAFAADGIFAITGPTGAGKSTILDALCLALYGSTPRLGRITAGGNEIMSRQTGECFAETSFATQAGRYRCHWSQRRARGQAGGRLQQPKHEIVDLATGKVLEVKLLDVGRQVEEVTGMDFDRFTRSMLLAQGGFSAFLQAAADERAPILEQITGTGIYSRISMAVHERWSGERRRLDGFRQELEGLQTLTADDEQQLAEALSEKMKHEALLTERIARQAVALAWLDGITRLEEDLHRLGLRRDDLQARAAAFAPQRERLRQAVLALELTGDHATLTLLRREQDVDRRSLEAGRASMPECNRAVEAAQERVTAAASRLEAARSGLQQAQPLLRRARELDLMIAEKEGPLRAAADAIASQETTLATVLIRHKEDSAALTEKRRDLDEVLRQLAATPADAGLVEHLAGIRGRCEALRQLRCQLAERQEQVAAAREKCRLADVERQQLTLRREAGNRELETMQQTLAARRQELLALLAGRELVEWRGSLQRLARRRDLLSRALDAMRLRDHLAAQVTELERRMAELRVGLAAQEDRLCSEQQRQAALQRELQLLETQLTLLARIEDLGEARRQLRDGEPCPLCGAREHPFALGNVPRPDATREELEAVRAELDAVAASLAGLQVALARSGRDLEHAAALRAGCAGQIAEAEERLATAWAELGLAAMADDPAAQLAGQLEETGRELEHAGGIVPAGEQLEKEIQALREVLENARAAQAAVASEVQAAGHRQETAVQLLERLGQEVGGLQEQLEQSQALLQRELQPFGVGIPDDGGTERLLVLLGERRERWLALQAAQTELGRLIVGLETQTRHQAEQIHALEAGLVRQRQLRDELLQLREGLAHERQELFGDRRPDDEEARLAGKVAAGEKELETARTQQAAAIAELGRLQARLGELERATATRDLSLQAAAGAFLERLRAAGFAGEEDFAGACLPEAERQTLALQAQRLGDEETELATLVREKTLLLADERERKLADRPREELAREQEQMGSEQRQLQQEIGGIRHRLQENQRIREDRRLRMEALDRQRRECERWDLLHELIGSADGKKFRNFAQGLTFEIVVGHANRQLRKMTDRYLLVRDAAAPLDLNVIDGYQAGEVRSTRNLSGGESFVVSLALALGLSQMASRTVRIDSLFLDEGFGTLDEEALETALQTLAGLRQDGKLIGVISHVPALRERIAARIRVQSGPGGRSSILGPGCRRVSG